MTPEQYRLITKQLQRDHDAAKYLSSKATILHEKLDLMDKAEKIANKLRQHQLSYATLVK